MHELGIAQAILDRVAQEAERRPGAQLRAVGVKVGAVSGVDCEALAFGFELLTRDTPWQALHLELERSERRQKCSACEREFAVAEFNTACPQCGNAKTRMIAGDELDISYIEVEDP